MLGYSLNIGESRYRHDHGASTNIRLSLNPAGTAASEEGADFLKADQVEVAGYRMLQAGGRNREFHSVLRRHSLAKSINQTRGERIAPSDAIDDMHLVRPAEEGPSIVMEQGSPIIDAGG